MKRQKTSAHDTNKAMANVDMGCYETNFLQKKLLW